jgi:hypothetical protein
MLSSRANVAGAFIPQECHLEGDCIIMINDAENPTLLTLTPYYVEVAWATGGGVSRVAQAKRERSIFSGQTCISEWTGHAHH